MSTSFEPEGPKWQDYAKQFQDMFARRKVMLEYQQQLAASFSQLAQEEAYWFQQFIMALQQGVTPSSTQQEQPSLGQPHATQTLEDKPRHTVIEAEETALVPEQISPAATVQPQQDTIPEEEVALHPPARAEENWETTLYSKHAAPRSTNDWEKTIGMKWFTYRTYAR